MSEQRALAVLEILIRHGVPEQLISAFGMGSKDPWYIDNFDENGRFIEEIAISNRKVVVITSDDDAMYALAEQVVSNGDTLTMFYYENGVLLRREFDALE